MKENFTNCLKTMTYDFLFLKVTMTMTEKEKELLKIFNTGCIGRKYVLID